MTAWGRAFINVFNGFQNDSETGLVRMFRIEYAKEYEQMVKTGQTVNEPFVKSFLNARI
jgi:hypothetical protein